MAVALSLLVQVQLGLVLEQVLPALDRPHLPAFGLGDDPLGQGDEVGAAGRGAGLQDQDVLGAAGADLDHTDLVVLGRRAGGGEARHPGDTELLGAGGGRRCAAAHQGRPQEGSRSHDRPQDPANSHLVRIPSSLGDRRDSHDGIGVGIISVTLPWWWACARPSIVGLPSTRSPSWASRVYRDRRDAVRQSRGGERGAPGDPRMAMQGKGVGAPSRCGSHRGRLDRRPDGAARLFGGRCGDITGGVTGSVTGGVTGRISGVERLTDRPPPGLW